MVQNTEEDVILFIERWLIWEGTTEESGLRSSLIIFVSTTKVKTSFQNSLQVTPNPSPKQICDELIKKKKVLNS